MILVSAPVYFGNALRLGLGGLGLGLGLDNYWIFNVSPSPPGFGDRGLRY